MSQKRLQNLSFWTIRRKMLPNNIGYRIMCNREPCNNMLNMNKIDTNSLIKQLDDLPDNLDVVERPAIYEGESFRSGYTRSRQHWSKYTTKSGQPNSFMHHHTQTNHSGVIGPSRGQSDYKIQITDRFTNNLRRQAQEGERQLLMEEYQENGKVNLLNSKLDFNKPFKSSLTVINKISNIQPGITGPTYSELTRAFGPSTKKRTVGECTNSTKMKTVQQVPLDKCTEV